jgi:fucose 4-O-acetylase-like acetyltransferase
MKRNIEIDILKGLLIIFVVIGHTDIKIPYLDVFWFHMPAFFLISGYLTKQWSFSKSKLIKFFVPYLCYSVVFYLLFSPEPLYKNIVRTLYGGRLNTLAYSYPYWFINAFALVNLGFGTILSKSLKLSKEITIDYATILFLISYILIHTPLFSIFPYPLPMSMDCAFGAYIYYYTGYKLKSVDIMNIKKFWIILILPALFIYLNNYLDWNYKINMKDITYNSLLLDMLVPCSFIYLLYIFSLLLKKVCYVSNTLVYIGSSSMTIFYTHAAILFLFKNEVPIGLNILFTIMIGLIIHNLFGRNKYTSIVFLGR